MRRPSLLLLAAAGLAAAGCASPGPSSRHVVVVSIDGFASFYLDDPRADLPNLRRLAREGAHARRMEVSFPSLTWVCHTTLVTGVSPARHGVIANTFFDRARGEETAFIGDAVLTRDEAVRAPTLYDAAHAAGLKTASVIWPATAGAKALDWAIPDSSKPEVHAKHTTPGLAEELERAGLSIEPLGRWGWDHAYSAPRDDLYTRVAVHLLERHAPSLLLLHLITPDGVEHDHGPQGPEAYWAVRYADQRIGELVAALERPPLRGRATLLVVSDHGFARHDREVRLNALFAREGLIELDAQGSPARRRAWAVAGGGSAAVYALEADAAARAALVERLAALLWKTEGVERVLRPSDFTRLGLPDPAADPRQADLMATAREGYAFARGAAGDVVKPTDGPRGAHGHLPQDPRMGALFVAWGAGVRRGAGLDEVRAVDVAPTAAALLGLELAGAEGRVVREILE
ncbi:MAG: alkaline phosphatase family protein [Planctomycetes bacterium]|nr:alkaline phosphatase family protein [Planctomycetota bacterium]